MKTLFARIVLSFSLTLVILILVFAAVLLVGYQRSTEIWSNSRIQTIEDFANRYFSEIQNLQTPEPHIIENFNLEIPLFLYNTNRNLVATNRGISRHRGSGTENLIPLIKNGNLLGYYASGSTQFRNDASNIAFLNALAMALVLGTVTALVIGFGAAIILSRSLVKPANVVCTGIDRFAQGQLDYRIPETGTLEIAGIAHSANIMAERLSQEQAIRAQWAQDVTHDLRTPVASVKVRLEAFMDGVFEPTTDRLYGVLEELTRIEALINDLEELTRLETPEMLPDKQIIALQSFADSIMERFSPQCESKNVLLLCEGPPICLRTDERLLYRGISNLLSNAILYSFPNTKIILSWGLTGESDCFLSVHNQGPTLSDEDQLRIFSRLYRADSSRTTRGSGLGLTITEQIAKVLGGSISVKSTNETGTIFSFHLPV